MIIWLENETYCDTGRNGGFPDIGWFRVFPKKNFQDEEKRLWELVAKRTRNFVLETRGRSVRVDGFENAELDGVMIPQGAFRSIRELKAYLKTVGYPSCTAQEMFLERNKAHYA